MKLNSPKEKIRIKGGEDENAPVKLNNTKRLIISDGGDKKEPVKGPIKKSRCA